MTEQADTAAELERRVQSIAQALRTLNVQVRELQTQTYPCKPLSSLHHLIQQAERTMLKLQATTLRAM